MPGSYKGWVFAANPVAYWPLNETAGTVAYDVVSGNNGNYAGGYSHVAGGPVGAGFDYPHWVAYFSGSSGYAQIPRLIGTTNFSIVFWVRTTATGGSPNWYNGQGLVDGSFYRLPAWGCYSLDGRNLEKDGVTPDVWMDEGFVDRLEGHQKQIDKAIEIILEQLK